MNKIELFLGNYSFVIDKDDKIIILKKDIDLLNNKFYTSIKLLYPPTILTQPNTLGGGLSYYPHSSSSTSDEYLAMRELILAYDNLKHHTKLYEVLTT